jgi:hypothetical protein
MSERETKTFATPAAHSVVFKAYLTGREAQELKSVLFGALKVGIDDAQAGKVNIENMSGDFLLAQERKAMSLVLVSLDGNTENVLEQLLDLPSSEYDAVKAEVDKITNPTKPGNSAQPGSGTSAPAA